MVPKFVAEGTGRLGMNFPSSIGAGFEQCDEADESQS